VVSHNELQKKCQEKAVAWTERDPCVSCFLQTTPRPFLNLK